MAELISIGRVAPLLDATPSRAAQGPAGPSAERRKECSRCQRPASVCLCDSLPPRPLATRGQVIILQHPAEAKKRLATVPLLSKCIANCHVLPGRTYKAGKHEVLRQAVESAERGTQPLFLLFPRPDSVVLGDAAREHLNAAEVSQGGAEGLGGGAEGAGSYPAYTLLVLDGTWRQGREMFNSVAPLLLPPSGPAVLVKLPPATPAAGTAAPLPQDGAAPGAPAAAASAGVAAPDEGEPSPAKRGRDVGSSGGGPEDSSDGGFYLRMEPVAGCLSTCEAVARALCMLESATGSGGMQSGGEVCEAVLRPLARLVEQQARFDPAVRARIETAEARFPNTRKKFGLGKNPGSTMMGV